MRDLRVFNFILIRNSVNIFVEKKIFVGTINCYLFSITGTFIYIYINNYERKKILYFIV